MSTPNANSGTPAPAQSAPAAAPTPASAPATPSVSPAAAFRDDVPTWVRSAGLEDAHNAAQAPTGVTPAEPTSDSAAPVDGVVPNNRPGAPAGQQPPAQPTAAPAQPAAVAPTALSPEAFAAAVRAASQSQQPAAVQPAPTDADIARELGVYTVTPDIYRAIVGVDGTPEQHTALNDTLQAIARQAVTINSVLTRAELSKLREEFAPYMNHIRTAKAEEVKTAFFAKHADLSGYTALVESVFINMKAANEQFPSLEAAGEELAKRTRAMLASMGITPQAPAAGRGTPPSRTTPPSRSMTPTSLGGRGGSGSSPAATKTTMQSVWG